MRTMKIHRLVLACHPREGGDPAFDLLETLDSRLRENDNQVSAGPYHP
jgi:hypothetical protein